MISVSKKLAILGYASMNVQERLAPFALAEMPSVAELMDAGLSTKAYAQQEGESWTAYLWLHTPSRAGEGLRVTVKRNCRSYKLAMIMANYFRLFTLINEYRNLNNDLLSSNY